MDVERITQFHHLSHKKLYVNTGELRASTDLSWPFR